VTSSVPRRGWWRLYCWVGAAWMSLVLLGYALDGAIDWAGLVIFGLAPLTALGLLTFGLAWVIRGFRP